MKIIKNIKYYFFRPKWYKVLDAHLRPQLSLITGLNALKQRLSVKTDGMLVMEIMTSRWAEIRGIEFNRRKITHNKRHLKAESLWREILLNEFQSVIDAKDSNSTIPTKISVETAKDRIVNIEKIVASLGSWPNVLEYILTELRISGGAPNEVDKLLNMM